MRSANCERRPASLSVSAFAEPALVSIAEPLAIEILVLFPRPELALVVTIAGAVPVVAERIERSVLPRVLQAFPAAIVHAILNGRIVVAAAAAVGGGRRTISGG